MSMDVNQDCPHCNSHKGQLCSETCTANGEKVRNLKQALRALNLYLGDNWTQIESYHQYKSPGVKRVGDRYICESCQRSSKYHYNFVHGGQCKYATFSAPRDASDEGRYSHR